jgi:hypothetical protein
MGPQGLTGPKGDKGDPGAPGVEGAPGTAGAPGSAGADGPAGPAGPAGVNGADGADGDDGATGPQGPQGDTGAEGPKGDTGAQGPKGDTGEQGPKGDKGDTGAQGPAGASGMVTAKEVYLDGAVAIAANANVAVTAVSLPAGSYRLDAMTRLSKDDGSSTWACALNGTPGTSSASDDQDSGMLWTQTDSATATMQLTATLSSAGTIVLRCRASAPLTASETKIIATPLGATNRVAGSAGAGGS